jgi:hypothetical protein
MGSMNLKYIDAVASFWDTPILFATAISSVILVMVTIKLLSLWIRERNTNDWVSRIVLIFAFIAAYMAAGFFQLYFAAVLVRDYYDINPGVTLGLFVPVVPVYGVGALSTIVFIVLHAMRKRRLRNDKGIIRH